MCSNEDLAIAVLTSIDWYFCLFWFRVCLLFILQLANPDNEKQIMRGAISTQKRLAADEIIMVLSCALSVLQAFESTVAQTRLRWHGHDTLITTHSKTGHSYTKFKDVVRTNFHEVWLMGRKAGVGSWNVSRSRPVYGFFFRKISAQSMGVK